MTLLRCSDIVLVTGEGWWTLRYSILGPLEVRDDAGVILEPGTPKQRAVLALLLADPNRVVSTDRLVHELWDDDAPDGATHTVQTYVSSLRKALDGLNGAIVTRKPGYLVEVGESQLDAAVFEASVTGGQEALHGGEPDRAADILTNGLAMWRGQALADIADDTPTLREEARRLDELRLEGLELRIEADIAAGRHRAVIGELERLTREYPFRESLWASLMLALYRSGRQADALRAYRTAGRALGEELGIEPSAELRALEEQMLLQDADLLTPTFSPPATAPTASFRVAGGYELRERAGSGRFGVVYRGYQPAVGREVAVKVIQPDLAGHPDFIRRFETEAQMIAQLEHPYIVPLYDYWRDPEGAYLVMRWLRGGDLARSLRQGPWNLRSANRLMNQASQALSLAHDRGVSHQDIKPANLLLDEEANVYVSDFGIAHNVHGEAVPSLASPEYASPESVDGRPVGPSSDIFSLGVTLFETVTGVNPFVEASSAVSDRILPAASALRADLPSALDDVLWKATATDPADRYQTVADFAAAFAEVADASDASPITIAPRNPYKGLRPFERVDAGDFFGRDTEVARLVGSLSEERLLVLVAPSGSGKSSLIKAGLLPAIASGALPGSDEWFIAEMVPDDDPFFELQTALLTISSDGDTSPHEILRQERFDAIEDLLPSGARLVLFIDQFEELFSLVSEEAERRRFLSLLTALVEWERVSVVLTIRADFLDQAMRYTEVSSWLQSGLVVVTPLDSAELRSTIVGPAIAVGVRVAPALVEAIATDIADRPGMLPMLQYALTELFDRREGAELTLESYREIGGVFAAIARRAEELYQGLDTEGRAAVREVMLRLVNIGHDGETTRRRIPRTRFHGAGVDRRSADRVLESYGQHRLLTFDRDPTTRTATAEIAHEALLTEWARLARWIDEAHDDLIIHRRLELAALEWLDADRDPRYLTRGVRLSQLEGWTAPRGITLTELEQGFLDASVAARLANEAEEIERHFQEERLEHRARQRSRALIAVSGIGVVVALVLTVWALRQQGVAEQQSDVSSALELIAAAEDNMVRDPELSVLLALEAVSLAGPSGGETSLNAEQVLRRSMASMRTVATAPGIVMATDVGANVVSTVDESRIVRIWSNGLDGVAISLQEPAIEDARADRPSLAMSGDGLVLAYVTELDKLTFIDPGSGTELSELVGPTTPVENLSLSPDGSKALIGSFDSTLLWDIEAGSLIRSAPSESNGGAFSANGTLVAYGTYDVTDETGSIIILDASTGAEVDTLCCHQGNVFALAFSPDASRIASVGFADGTLRLWNVADGSDVWLRNDPSGGRYFAVVFSTDGRMIAAGSEGGTVRIFDATTGAETMTLGGHQAPISNLAFTEDGQGLYSSSFDGFTRLWSLGPNQPDVVEFTAHPMEGRPNDDAVVTVAFSPSGDSLLTALGHDEALLWDPVNTVDPIVLAPLSDVFGVVMWGDFSPDGSKVAIGGIEAYPRVFDVDSGELVMTLEDPDFGHYRGVSFSPDGSRLVTAHHGRDEDEIHTPKIWDLETGTIGHRLEHEGWVWDVEWNPNGTVVATAGSDDTRIWDSETGVQLYTLDDPGVIDMAFSPDGSLLATAGFGDDGTLRIWDVESGEELANLEGHDAPVAAVAWSPDGTSIVTGSMDNMVKIWDVEQGSEIETLTEHPAEVWGVAWSADGTIATVSELGDVRLHRKDLNALERVARARVTRALTDAECLKFLGTESCSP